MNQNILLSTFIHVVFIGFLSFWHFNNTESTTFTPVYTVNLVSLPPVKKAPVPIKKKSSRKPARKIKSINLLSENKKSMALARLQTLEKDFEKDKQSNEIEENDIPEMLAALDKIKMDEETGLLDNREEAREKLLKELNELESELAEEKDNLLEIEKFKESKSLEQLEELENKWQKESSELQPYTNTGINEISEALEKLIASSGPVSSQNTNDIPSYLSAYYSLIQNLVYSNWKNQLGPEILSEKETSKKTTISFNIIRSGRIEDNKIHKSSGNHALDGLALMAVKNTDRLPPLPSSFHKDFLRVFIDFHYTIK